MGLSRQQKDRLILQLELFRQESIFYRKQMSYIRQMGGLPGWIQYLKAEIKSAEAAIMWVRKELGLKGREKLNKV